MKSRTVYLGILLMVAQFSIAQKIKYKDLFPLLSAKSYAEAGSQLRQYLADPKNQSEANPNLQMGFMLEDIFLKYDIVDDSSKLYATGDSAITYFNLAKSLIDEKELKKNDEYYQVFYRRDLRTGEFGIKVSDVHLDIEKKIESIQGRVNSVKSMFKSISNVEANHESAREAYKKLTDTFSSYNEMLLAADQADQALIAEVASKGTNAVAEARLIKETAQKLGSNKYQSEITLKPIEEFGKDGLSGASTQGGSISLWDFASWGSAAQSEIRGSVRLFKTMLNTYILELRDKKAKLKSSQNVGALELSEELMNLFQKYDPGSAAEKLVKAETFEARVIKQVDLQINPELQDSSRVGAQLKIYSEAKSDVEALHLLVESITNEDLEGMKKKYPQYSDSFFTRYATASKYVEEMRDWSGKNKEWIGNSVAYWTEKNKWGIIEKKGEAAKAVPLFKQDAPENGFFTMNVLVASIPEFIIYGGDMKAEKGYIGAFGEDRKEKWSLEFKLPGTKDFKYQTDTLPSAKGSMSFYIYNENAQTENFSVVSLKPSGTLDWSANVTLPKAPVDFEFDDLTQELTILLYPEEKLPLDTDELGYVVIDRTGNAR